MLDLFDSIEAGSRTDFEDKQLACAAKLVFYCGVRANEIPGLKVGDVIGKDGQIIRRIKIDGAPDINLNDAATEALEEYIAELRKRRPSFMQGRARLFPSYKNTDKLKRDLKRLGTDCRSIKEAGYHHYAENERRKGTREAQIHKNGAKQLRVTERQFKAMVTGHKIGPGKTADDRSVEEIMRLIDEAERLDKKAV
jgi:integrase